MNPETSIDSRFGNPSATATPWATADHILDTAEIFWISTVRRDGRPHVTPLLAVWVDEALHFTTGEQEQKAVNLRDNDRVVLTTGCNRFHEGIDIVVEGQAVRIRDDVALQRIADRIKRKYDWTFKVEDGWFVQEGQHRAFVYRVEPETIFGFKKGEPFSQTRWRFAPKAL